MSLQTRKARLKDEAPTSARNKLAGTMRSREGSSKERCELLSTKLTLKGSWITDAI
jgi:hypothetical protein